MSCIERCPHFSGKFILTNQANLGHSTVFIIHNTEVSLFQEYPLIIRVLHYVVERLFYGGEHQWDDVHTHYTPLVQ